MAPQILQWTTAECVEFLRKCTKQYAGIIFDADLDIYVKNFEHNHVAGSTISNFSDAQWNALIPSLGFGNYVRQQLQAKERICEQEMRTAVWNSSRKKAPEQQGKPTLKDMPLASESPFLHFFNGRTRSLLLMMAMILYERLLLLIL